MNKRSEPNAQNSELNPQAHPSGAHIEEMMRKADEAGREKEARQSEVFQQTSKQTYENRYVSPEEPAEGERGEPTPSPHRMDSEHREKR